MNSGILPTSKILWILRSRHRSKLAQMLKRLFFTYIRGGISFNTGSSFSTSWMWKMSPGKLLCPRMWNNIKKIFFNRPSRKLGKNVNLFHQNMNFFNSQAEKVSRFLIAGMWKLSLDVENEPPV